MKEGESFARLSTCVVPVKYYIDYTTVDLDHYRFEGKEKIEIKVEEDTNSITCHAVELYVFNVKIEYKKNGKIVSAACEEVRYLEKDQSVTFVFGETVSANTTATLTLEFHGILNNELRGFYRSEYEVEGEKRVMAVTQYQACDARRAFVCWDEPAIKAKYEISIVTDPSLVAISNTHVVQTQLQQKKNAHIRKNSRQGSQFEKLWKFAETPIMSTYLVGMVVGEFDSVSSFTKEGVLVTVYTPLGRSERGLFALDVATKALSFFTERFGIPYPLKKLDMLAIPDFAAGAMENWGIVTYRETRLLIDSHLSSFSQKCATARTVCHELAHQWFGNLVTMEWWTSLWLNEGFARFMEFEAVDFIFPEWKVWENFVQDITMSTAMVKDSMTTSHPIEVIVNHPDEVDQIFDVISYAKGASIIRMLTEFLGRDVFYKGIHEYLVKFSYGNAHTEDLWDALEKASGQKITNMANTWTSQTGYPIVTFLENDTKSSFEISQERFFAVKTIKYASENSLWDVPLTYVSSENPSQVQQVGIWQASTNFVGDRKSCTTPVMADESISVKCPYAKNGWIKFNPNQAGFYLVNYSSNGWKNLQQPVRDLQLNTVDRMSLLNSIFACARAGVLPVSHALDFSSVFINEPEHLCWTEISSNLCFYLSLFKGESFGPLFQKYVHNLFAGIMKKLTWDPQEGESSTDGQFRRDVISILGRAGDEEIINEAKKRFHEYFHHPQSCNLSADLRGVVFSIQARSGDETHAVQLRELYERSDFIEEKLDCLSTVGMFSSYEIKLEVLEWALEKVRSQDIQYVFGSVASGLDGAEFCWKYVKDHWEHLNKRFAPYIVGRIVVSAISPFYSEEKAAEVEEYMKTRKHDSYTRVLDAAIEKIRIKSSCFVRDRDSLENWLMSASF